MRTSITKRVTFDAAHHLPLHPGKCANVHGHTYTLEVTVERIDGALVPIEGGSPDGGMVIDFSYLNHVIHEEVVEALDHTNLNDVLPHPTAELLAHWAFAHIEARLVCVGAPVRVKKIRLYETADSWAEVEFRDA